MALCYNRLLKPPIDRGPARAQMRLAAGAPAAALGTLSKGADVNTSILVRICDAHVYRNWLLDRRTAEEDLGSKDRAEYWKQAVVNLSKQLTMLYGSSFDFTNLYKFMQFYRTFPILDSLCLKSGGLLDWSHYRTLLQVGNEDARRWYMEESDSQSWGVRTLQRNISSQYYEHKRSEGDNPTLGIILCADTDSDIARYSMLHGSEQLFASKYKLFLPSEEELRAEIEAQKTFWIEQHGNLENTKEVRS